MQLVLDPDMIACVPGETIPSELDDIDALDRVYRFRLLRFVAYSTGDQDLAETIVQDCLLKAYNARDSFRGDCSVYTWLAHIATNLVRVPTSQPNAGMITTSSAWSRSSSCSVGLGEMICIPML